MRRADCQFQLFYALCTRLDYSSLGENRIPKKLFSIAMENLYNFVSNSIHGKVLHSTEKRAVQKIDLLWKSNPFRQKFAQSALNRDDRMTALSPVRPTTAIVLEAIMIIKRIMIVTIIMNIVMRFFYYIETRRHCQQKKNFSLQYL